jgi:Zn-dependent protease/predicted transcriptional regulator
VVRRSSTREYGEHPVMLRFGPILGVRLAIGPFGLAAFGLLAVGINAVGVPGETTLSMGFGWVLGLSAALVLLVSYAAHELTHAVVARRVGVPIDEVGLFIFGDRTARDPEPSSGRAEALIAVSGVVLNLLAGALLIGAWFGLAPAVDEGALFVRELVWWSAVGNLAIAAINSVPAYPYDGGHLVRALLWAVTRDKMRATKIAANVGRYFSWGLIIGGAIWTLLTGDLFLGLWLVVTGVFLMQSSRRQQRRLEISTVVAGLTVGEVMDEKFAVVGPNLTLDTLFDQYERSGEVESYPVTADGVLLGSIDVDQIRRVPRAQWARTRVTEVMTGLERLPTMTGRESVMDALLRFDRTRVDAIPVVDDEGNHLVGLLTRDGLVEKLRPRVKRLAEERRAGSPP